MSVAVYEQMLTAAQDALADLTLSGIDPENVVGRTEPTALEDEALPRVVVCPGNQEDSEHASSEDDWVYYPVLVVLVAAANQDYATWRATALRWREQVRVALNKNKWADAPKVFGVDVIHHPVFDTSLLPHNTVWSALEFRYRATEARS